MGIVSRVLDRRSLENPSQTLTDVLALPKVKSGARVNERTALQMSAVLACVRVIAEDLASLPLPVYRRLTPRGRERALDHPLYEVLHDQPNPEMDSYTFRETLQAHVETWGMAYALKEFNGAGRIVELWPLRPDRTKAARLRNADGSEGRLVFQSEVKGRAVVLLAEEVFRVHGLGFDGITGYSPVGLAREAIGIGVAAEEFTARFYSNNGMPGGVLEHPKTLSDEAFKRLRKEWIELHEGPENAWKMAILEEGMKLHNLEVPQKDAQFLETRKFQVTDIARMWRVPPHMIGDHEKGATFASVEQQSLDYVVHTLRSRLVRWEQAIRMQLFSPAERKTHFAEFLVDGLLRGDFKSRQEGYAIGRQWGWLSANDIRELENQNPIEAEHGDAYLVPLNMQDPANPPPPPPEPPQPPAEPPRDDDDTADEDDEEDARALTEREREVAAAAARGLANKQIAAEIGLSLRTVERHLAAAKTKLGVATRDELRAWADRQ